MIGLASLAVMVVVAVALTKRVLLFAFPTLNVTEAISNNTRTVSYQHTWARFYNEVFLYFVPYLWAALFALSKSEFMYGKVKTYTARLFLSFLVATFSALVFKSMKRAVPKLFGVEISSVSDEVFEEVPDKKKDEG